MSHGWLSHLINISDLLFPLSLGYLLERSCGGERKKKKGKTLSISSFIRWVKITLFAFCRHFWVFVVQIFSPWLVLLVFEPPLFLCLNVRSLPCISSCHVLEKKWYFSRISVDFLRVCPEVCEQRRGKNQVSMLWHFVSDCISFTSCFHLLQIKFLPLLQMSSVCAVYALIS